MEIEHIFAVFFKQGSAGSLTPFKEIGMKVPFPVWHGLDQFAPHLTGTGVHATLAQQKERTIII
jgi:hypothetical protein